jgi:hypothetical protein
MNEGSGTNLTDYSVSGKPMQVYASPLWTNGLFGGEIIFTNTASQYAHTATALTVTSYTISIWAYYYSISGSQSAFGNGNPGSSGTLLFTSAGVPTVLHGAHGQVSGGTATQNAWINLCATYDGTTITIYTNGVYDTSGNQSMTAPATYESIAGASGNYAYGGFSDPRIYDRALTSNEVWKLYGAGYGCPTQ